MLRKKHVFIISTLFIILFIVVIIYSTYTLNRLDITEVRTVKTQTERHIHNDIGLEILNLSQEYTLRQEQNDVLANIFLKNSNGSKEIFSPKDLVNIWSAANKWVTNKQIFSSNDSNLGKVIKALKTAKIVQAEADPRGTQLKILLELKDGQKAVFKPQWYDKKEIILGHVYAGNDRYGAEILAFYLAGILDIRLAPIAVERIINLKDEIIPVATKTLRNTIFEHNNKTCVYGKCFYCKKEKPVCESSPGMLRGAIILHVPGKFNTHRSPWQRTYKKGKKAVWEYEDNYCQQVKSQLSKNRLLDLIDTAIFDFLIQNGDRHHYETLHDKVLLLDNGKGLGNPHVHHLDILAPLYQCCCVRGHTLERLKKLSGGLLQELLESIPEVVEVVSNMHIKSIGQRLLFIFATIEKCKKENKLLYY